MALSSIAVIFLAGLLGIMLGGSGLGWGGSLKPLAADNYSIQTWFVRWDALYYQMIAMDGYLPDGIERAFFPLYPLICGFLSKLTTISELWIGLAISVLSFVGSCLVLYKLVRTDYDHKFALHSVLLLCVFPMSFFFVSFYAESLFLALALGSVYLAIKGRFVLSGILIACAGGTSSFAPILGIPYFVEFFTQREYTSSRISRFITGALIAPIGMVTYLVFLGNDTGLIHGIKYFSAIQVEEWHRSFVWPWVTIFHGFGEAILGKNLPDGWFYRVSAIQNAAYMLLGIIISIWGWLNLRKSISLFFISGLTLILISHGPLGNTLMSFPRHLAILFPIYVVLALASMKLNITSKKILIGISVLLLILYTAWFSSGRWVA